MFSGLRQNSVFYILEKGDVPILKQGTIVSVSNPAPRYPHYGQYNATFDMVVDITVRVGEETMDFKQLPCNLGIANFGTEGMVVSDNREAMLSEVEGMLRNSKEIVESIPRHNSVIDACEGIIRKLNPQIAKEKIQEEKIGTLEKKMDGVENTLTDIQNMLSKALSDNNNSKTQTT